MADNWLTSGNPDANATAPEFPVVNPVPVVPVAPAPVVATPAPTAADLIAQAVQGGPNAELPLNVARQNDNGLATNNQVLLDRHTLSPYDFLNKYGTDVVNNVNTLDAANADLVVKQNIRRTSNQKTTDLLRDVNQGLASGVGGVAVLGAGIVGNITGQYKLGTEAAQLLTDYQKHVQSTQTSQLQKDSLIQGIKANLDTQDNNAAFDANVAKDGKTIANLKYIAKDAVDSVTRLASDPEQIGSLTAQGVGSVLAAGPITKGLSVLGKAVAKVAGTTAIEGSVPVAIGSMEGGGAFQQTAQQVMDMNHEDLMKNSPEYRQLIADGKSQNDAKAEIASKAGTTAAAIQGPIAALTGKLVEPFEAHPFAPVGLKTAGQNIGKEFTEELLQSGSGQFAQNVGVQQHADQTQALGAGVVDQGIQGAVAGALSAGAIEAPVLAIHAPGAAVSSVVNAVINKGQSTQDAALAAAPNSPQNVSVNLNSAQTNAPNIAASVVQNAQVSGTPAQVQTTQDYVNKLASPNTITPEVKATLPDHLQSNVTDNKVDSLVNLAQVANDPKAAPEDKLSAALFIKNQIDSTNNTINNAPDLSHLDDATHKVLTNYTDQVSQIGSIKQIQDAIKTIDNTVPLDPAYDSITDKNVATPQSIQTVNNIVGLATAKPSAVNPEIANQIIAQNVKGNITLTPEQLQSIKAANALNEVANDQTGISDANTIVPEGQSNLDRVSSEIETVGGIPDYQRSLEQHVQGINQAVTAGDSNTAKSRLTDLNRFAQHMSNKAEALINSYNQNGAPQQFKALGADHQWLRPDSQAAQKPQVVKPDNEKSVEYMNRVIRDSKLVSNLANNMNTIYSVLGVKPVPLVQTEALPVKETTTNVPTIENTNPSLESAAPTDQTSKASESSPTKEEVASRTAGKALGTVTTPIETVVVEPTSKNEPSITEPANAASEALKPSVIDEPTSLPKQYSNLIGKINNVKNMFLQAFKSPKNEVSRMARLTSPLSNIFDMLDVPSDLVKFIGGDTKQNIDRKMADAWQSLLAIGKGDVLNEINSRLEQYFKTGKDGKSSLEQKFLDGLDVTRLRDALVTNLLEPDGTSFKYNEQLMETAIIAGLHWSVNAHETYQALDASEVAALLNLDEGAVTEDQLNEMNRGMSLSDAKRDLAAKITEFWGVKTNNNIAENYSKGIPEAVAAEVLHGLIAAGLISFQQIKGDNKTFNRILMDERSDDTNGLIHGLIKANNLMAEIAQIESPMLPHIGKPATEVAKQQMRNPLVDNTKAQRKALDALQNTPHLTNMVMADLIKGMGEENFVGLMGGDIHFDDKPLNVNHRASIEGKTRTLRNSFQNVLNHVEQVIGYAKSNNLDPRETPSFFGYNVSRVGRMQASGLSNPQSDKLAREIFMPTKSVLDLNNESDLQKFLMTIGQGLGLKTEKVTRTEVANQVQSAMSGKYKDLLTNLGKWLDNTSKPIPQADFDMIKQLGDISGGPLTMHGLHGLISMAQYVKGENLSNFEHFNYLEADGKTNGPIMSLMLFATGKFTGDWLKDVAKGGIFVGSKDKTLNSHIQSVDSDDLYKKVADKLSSVLNTFTNQISNLPEVAHHNELFRNLLSDLDANITLGPDGTLQIARGATKNPLTISIYGSGIDGIAAKVVNELMGQMYEKMSQGIDPVHGYEQLFQKGLVNSKKNGYILINDVNGKTTGPNSDLTKFTFSEQQFNALKMNVRAMYVDHMAAAINDSVLSKVSTGTKVIQQATQFQSVVLAAMFRNKVINALAEKALNPERFPDYKKGDFLSNNELDAIRESLKPYHPFIETKNQTFFLTGAERQDLVKDPTQVGKSNSIKVGEDTNGKAITVGVPESFSRSLSGDFSSPAYIYGPTLAGVKAVPSLNIGAGDGEMILNYINGSDAINSSLPVFDGINIAANNIDKNGQKANEAVHQAINNNPLEAVSDMFKGFVRANPLEDLMNTDSPSYDFVMNEFTKMINGTQEDSQGAYASTSEVQTLMSSLASDLSNAAEDVSTRQEALRRVSMSVDQMASAESPFTQDGQTLDHLGYDEKAHILNQHLQDIQSERLSATPSAVEQPHAELTKAINEANLKQGNVQVIPVHALNKIMNSIGLNANQKILMNDTINNLKDSGYKVIFGTPEDLKNYQYDNHPELYDLSEHSFYGKVIPSIKTIFVSNIAPETILHELIHASTIEKTLQYYSNPTSLSQEDQAAFKRLEGLMYEYRDLNVNSETNPARQAFYMSQDNGVDQYLAEGKDAEALNEFMAWSLSNQNIIKVLQKTRIKNPLLKLAQSALASIKSLIFGSKLVNPKDDFFSNIQFNTQILLSTETNIEAMISDINNVAMYQSPGFGTSNYLSDLRAKFAQKVISFVNSAPTQADIAAMPANTKQERANRRYQDSISKSAVKTQVYDALRAAQELSELFISKGFHMDAQTKSTFKAIQATLMTGAQLNTNALAEMQDQYSYVMKQLDPKMLQDNPLSNDPNEEHLGQDRYGVLNGVFGSKTDAYGRSSLMASFMALAMTHPQFRDILHNIPPEKAFKSDREGIDGFLENMGNNLMDKLGSYVSGSNRNALNVVDAIDALKDSLRETVSNDLSIVENTSKNIGDKFDTFLTDKVESISDNVYNKANDVLANSNNPLVKGFARTARIAAAIINEKQGTVLQKGITASLNEMVGNYSIRELFSEITGRVEDNKKIFDMISKVRAAVQQVRQMFRDDVPAAINKQFTRALTEQEKTDLFKGLGKTDLAVLKAGYSLDNINTLITNSTSLNNEIKNTEDIIKAMDPSRFAAMQVKAQQLATFMNTGVAGANLLRNAYAVAHMFGESQIQRRGRAAPIVPYMDQLISMYALKGLDQSTKDSLINLVNTEKEGVNFALSYLIGSRSDELVKINNDEAKVNHYKGHLPSEQQLGTSMIVADVADEVRLVSMGYKNVGSYDGSSSDLRNSKQAYYYNSVTGRATFNQGVLQTVHQTVSGIDPRTGRTTGLTAGYINDPQLVRAITAKGAARATSEHLMPVYDDLGKITAYERSVDPSKLGAMNNNTDLPAMVGAWMGRQFEERLAKQYNGELIDNLKEIWDKAKKDRITSQFVRLDKSSDPIEQDAWRVIPNDIKDLIKNTFGTDGFPVRRDMVNDTVGYRSASVGDLWSGNTRWKPGVAEGIKNVAIAAFGKDAYAKLVKYEHIYQNVISDAKTLIVVKSVIVPMANIASNAFQLTTRGVPIRVVIKGMIRKTDELNKYIIAKNRQINVQGDLFAAQGRGDQASIRKLQTELQTINDGMKRMQINPLIEAGEYSVVSDGGVTQEDLALANGKFAGYIEDIANRVPEGIKTPVRYALVTKDTALFQGLARAVQYGDFLAKSVYYDYLTGEKKMTPEEALGIISEEYVNFNRLPGRTRGYLESMGTVWFWNYKIKNIKIAANMLRNNPFRSIMGIVSHPTLPIVGSLGSPVTDNFLSIWAQGKLGYSMGLGMGFRAPQMSPIWNILN